MGSDRSPTVFGAQRFVCFKEPKQRGRVRWRGVCIGLLIVAGFECAAQDGRPAQSPAPPSATTDVSRTDQPRAESQRKKQISADSTQLLAMAVDLKAEVDKTNKDTLSLNVIRKADAIEKLAKTVKEKMKQNSIPAKPAGS